VAIVVAVIFMVCVLNFLWPLLFVDVIIEPLSRKNMEHNEAKRNSLLKKVKLRRVMTLHIRVTGCRHMGSHSVTCHQTQVNTPHLTVTPAR